MAQFSSFWKVITPPSKKQEYAGQTSLATDAYDPRTTDVASLTTVNWYSQVMKGPGSRAISYKQFDAMDADVDIARSLDVIAEEMTPSDAKTRLPFLIEYNKEDNEDVSDTTAVTIRQTMRHWANTQKLDRRLFSIARDLIKYGDCFFRKFSDTKPWEYIHPSLVYGIEVDRSGTRLFYHLKKPGQQSSSTTFGMRNEEMERVPASAIIHFSMSEEMGDSAPFGQSVLRPIFRVYRQLSMIEDAVIIYRIVRAPERRVFYVDVGNLPPQRVKTYLEQMKNELRQKRVPGLSNNGQKDTVDGQYDPMSMQEDYFLPVTASGRGSKVETLPGGTEDFGTNLLKYFQDKMFRGLRIPTSYMNGQDAQGAQANDGKVGIAYIEELRFANFIMRLQERLNDEFDRQFKTYMKVLGINVDSDLFMIRLPDPSNFALYRQAALDSDLITSFSNISQEKTLSKRFLLKRYLGLTDDEIQMNEVMIKEERGIRDNTNIPALQQIYDPAVYDNRDELSVEEPAGGGDSLGMDTSGPGGGFFDGGGDAPAETPPAEEPPAEEPPAEETPPTA